MKANARAKMRNKTPKATRKEQELATLQESLELNDDRMLGIERGKVKHLVQNLPILPLKQAIYNSPRWNNHQLKYFVDELVFCTHPGFSEEMTRKRNDERERVLNQCKTANDFKKIKH